MTLCGWSPFIFCLHLAAAQPQREVLRHNGEPPLCIMFCFFLIMICRSLGFTFSSVTFATPNRRPWDSQLEPLLYSGPNVWNLVALSFILLGFKLEPLDAPLGHNSTSLKLHSGAVGSRSGREGLRFCSNYRLPLDPHCLFRCFGRLGLLRLRCVRFRA